VVVSRFAEEIDHDSREFICGWSLRAETAEQVAMRIHRFARRLAEIEPRCGDLWPLFAARRLRRDDPGPVLNLSLTELAGLIDRRCRLNPPPPPAPVDPEGFLVTLAGHPDQWSGLVPGLNIWAGASRPPSENHVKLAADLESPLWRDEALGLFVLHALIDVWDAEWAAAYASIGWIDEEGWALGRDRPWLAWTAKPLQPRPVPPYSRAYPYPLPFEEAGPASEVRQAYGGELQVWF
jgi:hypothetical protein